MSRLWINSLGEVGRRNMPCAVFSEADIKKLCTPAERSLIRRVWAMQEAVNTCRFRVYLGTGNKILLSTEFTYFSDEKEIAKGIRWLAKSIGARVLVMGEFEHMDEVTYFREKPPRTVTGPNHRRMETQVEMVWVVEGVREAKRLVKMAEKETQELWENYGVSVL